MKTNGAKRTAKPRKNGAGNPVTETTKKAKPPPAEFALMRRGQIINVFASKKEAETSGRRRYRDRDFLVLDEPELRRELLRYAKLQTAELDVNLKALNKNKKRREQLAKKYPRSYALMKGGRIFGYYYSQEKAFVEGRKRFKDGVFSAPKVKRNERVYHCPHVEVAG